MQLRGEIATPLIGCFSCRRKRYRLDVTENQGISNGDIGSECRRPRFDVPGAGQDALAPAREGGTDNRQSIGNKIQRVIKRHTVSGRRDPNEFGVGSSPTCVGVLTGVYACYARLTRRGSRERGGRSGIESGVLALRSNFHNIDAHRTKKPPPERIMHATRCVVASLALELQTTIAKYNPATYNLDYARAVGKDSRSPRPPYVSIFTHKVCADITKRAPRDARAQAQRTIRSGGLLSRCTQASNIPNLNSHLYLFEWHFKSKRLVVIGIQCALLDARFLLLEPLAVLHERYLYVRVCGGGAAHATEWAR
ncbi:hypothetical protein EVAR_89600_1 [Eumeta japonica]|uniref:Uncharacterized protein n=1 Tax=Eumeta variegata TaxID=151549 RepID=A0A4C1XPQ9_EUMVA|nr:hypothetical protein EVAR_89600_1 [Eumeta japonica]